MKRWLSAAGRAANGLGAFIAAAYCFGELAETLGYEGSALAHPHYLLAAAFALITMVCVEQAVRR